jgi:hypothetical protein
MYDKLEQIEQRYDELQQKIADPAIVTDVAAYRDTMKAISEIDDVVRKYRQLKNVRKRLSDANEMLKSDDEMRELAELELAELAGKEPKLEEELKILLQPKDPNDEKNVFVEIRAGTGGDEASLFADEVMRMYIRYAESKRWKVDVTNANYSPVNGIKDATLQIEGAKVYSRPAGSTDRDAGPHPHFGHHGRRSPGSGRHRHPDSREGSAHRYLLLLGPRRPVRKHHLLRRAYDAPADGRGRLLPGREVADQEPAEGAQGPEGAPL